MKTHYTRKAIFTLILLATLCQNFPTYLLDNTFHDFTSVELEVEHENETENEKDKDKKNELEENKDKIHPQDFGFLLEQFGIKSNNHFNQNSFSNYKTEIFLPPPRTVA